MSLGNLTNHREDMRYNSLHFQPDSLPLFHTNSLITLQTFNIFDYCFLRLNIIFKRIDDSSLNKLQFLDMLIRLIERL